MTERTEYVGFYVSKEMKEKIRACENDEKLRDDIIKHYIDSEKENMKETIKNMDECDILYRSALLNIKDKMAKASEELDDEFSKIYARQNQTINIIKNELQKMSEQIEKINDQTSKIKLSYVNIDLIERLMNVCDRYNKMTEKEKEIIAILIQQK